MKRITFFKEMKVGSSYETDTMIINIEERKSSNSGMHYLVLHLSDGKDIVKAIYYNVTTSDMVKSGINVGDIARVSINVMEKNNKKGFYVYHIVLINSTSEYRANFLPRMSNETASNFCEIIGLLDIVSNNNDEYRMSIGEIGKSILLNIKNEFAFSAGGKSKHHAFIGGLLKHSLGVAMDAYRYCELHPEFDRELLVTAAALHDIGKIRELKTAPNGVIDYSPEGRYLKHSITGVIILEEYVNNLLSGYDYERVALLKSMIAEHHNSTVISKNRIPELGILNSLDRMDAQRNAIFGEAA